jgi:hypothetical protein
MTEPVATEEKPDDRPRDFAAFLLEHARGRSHDELSQALRALVLAVADVRKPGKLTYVVHIKPQPKVEGAVLVGDEIRCTLPQFDRSESIFFTTDAGDLTRSDPHQTRLFE